jgi:hypothetical protein
LSAGQFRFVGPFRNRRGIRQIELVLPDRGKSAPQLAVWVESGFDCGNHDAVRKPGVERPVRRLQVEFQAALVAPVLQLKRCRTGWRFISGNPPVSENRSTSTTGL